MNEITMIPVDQLIHHPNNPRLDLGDLTELTESIRSQGVLQNLTVVPGHMMSKEEWTEAARAEVEVAEKLPEEATITGEEKEQLDELTRDGMPLDEAMESIANVEAPQPMKFEGMKVTAVEQDGFQIQREGKNGEKITVNWPLGKDAEEITLIFKQMTTLGVNDWKKFMKIMPKAMRILGVDAG